MYDKVYGILYIIVQYTVYYIDWDLLVLHTYPAGLDFASGVLWIKTTCCSTESTMYGTVFSILYSVLCRLRQWRDFLAMHIYPAGFNLQTFALHYFWFCSITGQRESQPGMSGGCTAYRFWCIVQWHGHTWVQSIAGQKQRERERATSGECTALQCKLIVRNSQLH